MNRQLWNRLLLPLVIPLAAFALLGLLIYGFSRVLLGVPVVKTGSVPNLVATAVAIAVAILILVLAAALASVRTFRVPHLVSLPVVVVGAVLVAFGIATATVSEEAAELAEEEPPGASPVPGGTVVSIGAENIAFDTATLSLPAGMEVAIRFTNNDAGVPHNVAIYSEDPLVNPAAEVLFQGEIFEGVATTEYRVPGLDPGTYFFRCDVHPTQMTGTLTAEAPPAGEAPPAEEPAPPPEGEAAAAVELPIVGKDIAFDTSTLSVAPDTPFVVVFDHQDAGIPHNFAIYTEQGGDLIAKTEIETGPVVQRLSVDGLAAGTYYYQCDVHPTTMTGSLEVG